MRLRPDARILVWLLALVFATGLPLMFLFDGDATDHRARLAGWTWLRHLHAGATLALLAGSLWHVAARWLPGSAQGQRSGAWALASIALAVVSGALAAQTRDADRIAGQLGLEAAPPVLAAVVHVAYATILVLVAVYVHIARWGWRRVFAEPAHLAAALAVAALVAWSLPVALPGDSGGGATAWAAPSPWALWTWPFIVAVAAWAWGRRGPRQSA